MIRAPIKPALLIWARERAEMARGDLLKRFPKIAEWESGTVQPTMKQLDAFAASVHVPVGYLFLSKPPEEPLPLPDFRTIAGSPIANPSPNLLDVIYTCQGRQTWYRNFALLEQLNELTFISSVTLDDSPEVVATHMRDTIDFDLDARRECSSWNEALRLFTAKTDDAGILVMVSGIVDSNTSRRLDPQEFRGFALSDRLAPLIFVNGADSKAAQMFTLAHELAHLWLGSTALSDCQAMPANGLREDEIWCNAVAAEFLVPLVSLKEELSENETLSGALRRLTRLFKVSSLVVLRRLQDLGWLDKSEFEKAWSEENARLRSLNRQNRGSGGDFYRTTLSRVGKRFSKALVASTLEGQTLYRDAYRMLGVRSGKTFDTLARQVIEG